MKRTAGFTRMDKKRNADIYREHNALLLLDYLENNRHD